jgi:RNA polymerase sigma-70 factor (ECF subfamily)
MSLMVWHAAGRDVQDESADLHVIHSDDALVLAAQANSADYAALYQRYVDPVYRFCYRRLGNRAAAEDATSVVFERALKALPRFTTGSFRGWLFTIARNAITDVHRSNKGDQDIAVAWDVVDERPGPEEISVNLADGVWIRGLLKQLSPDQRQVVELRLAELTDIEIAQSLGRSHGSVRTVQYRALRKLRALFEADKADALHSKEHDHGAH